MFIDILIHKVSIHGDLQHLFHMFQQISCTPDFERRFLEKKVRCICGCLQWPLTFLHILLFSTYLTHFSASMHPKHCHTIFVIIFPYLSDGMYKAYLPSQISGQWHLRVSPRCKYPSQSSAALMSESSEDSICSVYSWLYDTAPERQTVCCNLWHTDWCHFTSVINNRKPEIKIINSQNWSGITLLLKKYTFLQNPKLGLVNLKWIKFSKSEYSS